MNAAHPHLPGPTPLPGPLPGPDRAADERYRRYMAFSLFAITLARLWFLALGHSDLYPDEAQYWLWSLHPSLGYYSKPPLVAWLIALTTHFMGENEFAIRLASPLLHFGTALVIGALARRLYDARIAAWAAITYATLPGVSASAIIMSTDAPLLFCWSVALYAFLRAREADGGRWWLLVGAAVGLGLLSKYAMGYWLLSGLLYLLLFRDERRHIPRFLAATVLALAIYAPNFVWNLRHGFATYHATGDNASWHGLHFHLASLLTFLGSQFGVFGPLLFASLIAIVLLARRALADRRAALLAAFTLPTLGLMLIESVLSRAQPNWAAPAYVAASVLVVAWLFARGWRIIVILSIALHVVAAVLLIEARPLADTLHVNLPAKFDPMHRLRGWRRLGDAVSRMLADNPGAILLSDDREDLAALTYYVHPHPFDALKWNGDGGIHDEFDLTAHPERDIGRTFLLVSHAPDVSRITSRFTGSGPIGHILIVLGGGASRSYTVRVLTGFKGYAAR